MQETLTVIEATAAEAHAASAVEAQSPAPPVEAGPMLRVVGVDLFVNRGGWHRPGEDPPAVIGSMAFVGGAAAARALESIHAGAEALVGQHREALRDADKALTADHERIRSRLAEARADLAVAEQAAAETARRLEALWRTEDSGPEVVELERALAEAEGRMATQRRKIDALAAADASEKRVVDQRSAAVVAEATRRQRSDLEQQADYCRSRLTEHLAKAEDDIKALAVLSLALQRVAKP